GAYANASNLVRVEVSGDVDNQTVDATALPFSVRGAEHLVTSSTMPMTSPSSTQLAVSDALKQTTGLPVPMRNNIHQGSGQKLSVNPLLYWGVRFEHVTSVTTPNASTLQDKSMLSFAKYFPDFTTTQMAVVISDNASTPATAQDGQLDSDKFCL